MIIELFQDNPQFKVSHEFLEKWGKSVDEIFSKWSSKNENKLCINEYNKPKKEIDKKIMKYVEEKFKVETNKIINISDKDLWLLEMTETDLNLILQILKNLPSCNYFIHDDKDKHSNLNGYNVSKEKLIKFYRDFGYYYRKWINNEINQTCLNKSNEIIKKYELLINKYFEKNINHRFNTNIKFESFDWIKQFSENDLKIIIDFAKNVPKCSELKKQLNNIDTDTDSSTLDNNIIITSESDSDPKNLLIRKISIIKEKYYLNNKNCFDSFQNNMNLYSHFLKGYKKYLESGFQHYLKNIPDADTEDNMTYKELHIYHQLLKKIPKCSVLIHEGSKISNNDSSVKKVKIANNVHKKNLESKIKANNIDSEDIHDSLITSEEQDFLIKTLKPNISKNIVSESKNENSVTTTIASIAKDNPPTITTIMQKNRGKVKVNPFGERKTSPTTAPYLKYVKQIGKQLQDINISVKKVGKKLNKEKTEEKTFIENMKNLISEQKLKTQIESEDNSKLDYLNNKLYQKSNVDNYKLMSHNQDNNIIEQNKNKNVGYRNIVNFDHLEPNKKIMSAYGWSYMPPQTWSVPQKRPPVCIPSNNNNTKVMPLLEKGAPVDALDWTQVGSILPKFEYNEYYNPDYYYPGWKSQKQANYPKYSSGKNFSSKYYNNNRAEKISK